MFTRPEKHLLCGSFATDLCIYKLAELATYVESVTFRLLDADRVLSRGESGPNVILC